MNWVILIRILFYFYCFVSLCLVTLTSDVRSVLQSINKDIAKFTLFIGYSLFIPSQFVYVFLIAFFLLKKM